MLSDLRSIFNYYVERVYDGNPKKSKKAFDKLEPADRKSLKREFKKCMHEYMDRLEQYLSSLSKVVSFSLRFEMCNCVFHPNPWSCAFYRKW